MAKSKKGAKKKVVISRKTGKPKRPRSPKQKALDKKNGRVMKAAHKACVKKHTPFTKAYGKCTGEFRRKAAKKR